MSDSVSGDPALRAPWRVLNSRTGTMAQQLARSEALLACMTSDQPPTVRWYVTRQQALVLGNGQKPTVVNMAACQAQGIEVVRRTSGGTAVLVDADALSMEVALPPGHPLATTDIVRGYAWIGHIWAAAFQNLGIASARALPVEELRALPPVEKDDPVRLACYGTLSPWEVVSHHKKVVGLCQVRRRTGTLYQVGIYLRWQPENLVTLLAIDAATRTALAARLGELAIGVDELAGRSVRAEEVRAAVEGELMRQLDVSLRPGSWRTCERLAAQRIQLERFQPVIE